MSTEGRTAEAPTPPATTQISFTRWSGAGLAAGEGDGVILDGDGLVIGSPAGTMSYTDPFGDGSARDYEHASWVSPVVAPGFALTELVPSWNASTPAGTWLQVEVRGTAGTATSGWYVLGRWASYDEGFHRTTVEGQADDLATVDADILRVRADHAFSDWQLRLTLYRATGTAATPRVTLLGVMSSALADQVEDPGPSGGGGRVLDVPTYSQEIHKGEYPEYDKGGEAWCSPTSTAMVLDYWGAGPTGAETSWVDPSYVDPQVDHAARHVFDYTYDGAGNWPFNGAYAASRGLQAFVTRLRSLAEAERFIEAGIPLITSVSFKEDELAGAGYSTAGHLMVLVGLDAAGNPVMNDPASHQIHSNDEVRVTYDRAEFERAWSRSGRIVYVLHPTDVPLPPAPAGNW